MSDQGKANYEAWREAGGWHGSAPEDLEYDDLPAARRHPFDVGADAVEQWLAALPVDQDAQDWERRTQAAGTAPGNEPQPAGQYALVELMGHAQATGSWRETALCGRPMLEITRLDVAERRVQLVGPESVYRLTPLTEAEAMSVTRYARAAIAAPEADDDPWAEANEAGAL